MPYCVVLYNDACWSPSVSVASLGRSGPSVVHAVEALSQLVLVASAQTQDAAPAVQLVADILVHLAELVELAGDLVVLRLHNRGVLLKGVLLCQVVHVVRAKGSVRVLVCLQVLPLKEELVLAVLEASLEVADLQRQVMVASALELVVLAEFVEVGNLFVGIAPEDARVASQAPIKVLGTSDLLLDIFEEQLLVAEVVGASIDELLSVVDAQVHA